jgi:hypothetical protein
MRVQDARTTNERRKTGAPHWRSRGHCFSTRKQRQWTRRADVSGSGPGWRLGALNLIHHQPRPYAHPAVVFQAGEKLKLLRQ